MISNKITILNQTILDCLKETDEKKIIKKFAETAIKILDADYGFAWAKTYGARKLELIGKNGNTPFEPTIPRKSGTTYSVLHSKTPLLIKDVTRTKHVRKDRQKYLKSLAIIPITYKNRTYGNFYICFKSRQNFSKDYAALCLSIGNSVAQAITINRLNQNLQDIKHTLDYTSQPMLIFDPVTLRISYLNRSVLQHSGLDTKQLLGAPISVIIHPSYHKTLEKRLKHIIADKVPSSLFEVAMNTKNSRKVPAELLLQYVSLPGRSPHLLAIFQDLRQRKKSEEQIKHAAFHDTLTGLPNRLLFTNRLNTLLAESAAKNRFFAVIFVDLDRFKLINDTVGHLIGDSLLTDVAARLKKSVKRIDTVSRFGGDEFVILIANLKSPKHAEVVAQRIQKAFEQPFEPAADQEIYVNFSMGISVFPKDGNDAASLLRHADTALYQAKQHGGNSYQIYRREMTIPKADHLEIEKDLRRAINNKELILHYQPIIDLKSEKMKSVEALVRWQHPTMGLLLPSTFIPYAEESGLIVKLGEWVFAESCRQLGRWRKAGLNTTMGINISARELLQKNMIRKIQKIIKQNGLKASDITLELTETFLIKNMETSTKMLDDVRKLGFKTSLDGFGTGYASLSYLKKLPVDYIKIDHPLIGGALTNKQDAGIIGAIIDVAHHLNIKVVAEGVENKDQIEFLRQRGCDMVQGNFYSPPAMEILDTLNKGYYK